MTKIFCVILVFAQIAEKSQVGWAARVPDLKALEKSI